MASSFTMLPYTHYTFREDEEEDDGSTIGNIGPTVKFTFRMKLYK